MDPQLKQRLVGTTILVALAVIFVPMLFDEHPGAPNSTSQNGLPPVPDDVVEKSTLELPKTAEDLEPKESETAEAKSGFRIVPLTDEEPAKKPAETEKPKSAPVAGTEPVAEEPVGEGEEDFGEEPGVVAVPPKQAEKPVTEPAAKPAPPKPAEKTAKPAPSEHPAPAPKPPVAKAPVEPKKPVKAATSVPAEPAPAPVRKPEPVREPAPAPHAEAPTPAPKPVKPAAPAKPAEPAAHKAEPAKSTDPDLLEPPPFKPAAPRPQATAPKAAAPAPAAPSKPAPAAKSQPDGMTAWVVQTGSFTNEAKARALADKLRQSRFAAFVETAPGESGPIYRVQVGPDLDRARAEQTQKQIESNIGIKGLIIPHP